MIREVMGEQIDIHGGGRWAWGDGWWGLVVQGNRGATSLAMVVVAWW